jgi:aldehyde dehydrogenase
MVAAGNTLVINAHPGGARCAAVAVREFNQAIEREIGISNVVTIVETPSLDSFNELCASEDLNLLCVTGGPGVVNSAMKSGKRAICAGPGNPPVLVDETANLDKAAAGIIFGGSFDNNLLCIGEKEIFVVDAVYNKFLEALKKAGAAQLNSGQLDRLTKAAFTDSIDAGVCSHPVLNRDLVGRDPSVLADIAGASIASGTELLFAETEADHPFVFEEQMMPMVPVIRVRDVQEGIERSIVAEHGYKHSAMIHSLNVEHMTQMLQALDCTLFVKNGACLAGLGTGGEGYSSFSIATTTGEGITTPKTFTRTRRCVLVDSLRSF